MSTIELIELPRQATLYVKAKAKVDALGATLNELLPRVYQQAMYKGAGPGRPFVRYTSMGADGFGLEIGVSVHHAITPEGEFLSGELGGPHAQLRFVGPYDRLRGAHEEVVAWCQKQKKKPAGPPLEVYLTDPRDEKDPEKWETLVLLPVG